MNRVWYPLCAGLLGLGLWQAVVWITGAAHFILPDPWRVAKVGYENRALIAEHTLVTATEVALGLVIGSVLGALTAIQLAASPRLARLTLPMLVFTQAVPVFHDGLTRVSPALLDLAQTMGASPSRVMRRIRIPHALPSLASGLKLAAVYAPIGAVIGEWVGSSKGLGYLMLLANGRAKVDLMFASLIALAVLTVALHKAVSLLAQRLNEISRIE